MVRIAHSLMGRGPIPAGRYVVEIADSSRCPMKDGSGETLELALKIIEGEFAGRKLHDWINRWSSKADKVARAKEKLDQILKACGKSSVDDSEELHGIPIMIKVVHLDDRRGAGNPFQMIDEYSSVYQH